MPWSVFNIQIALPSFALILFRVSGLALASPLFGSRAIPPRIIVAFIMVITVMMFPMVHANVPPTLSLAHVVPAVFSELIIGLLIGMSVDMVFLGARLAGMMIGQQAGISLGQVVNPLLDDGSTVVDQVYYFVTLMVFLVVGGHRTMIRALLDSFAAIPIGSFELDGSLLEMYHQLITGTFIVGIRLAAPALTALFLASLAMGFLARTIPQINILTIGFQVRIFVGLSVAGFSLALSYDLLYDAMLDIFDAINLALGLTV